MNFIVTVSLYVVAALLAVVLLGIVWHNLHIWYLHRFKGAPPIVSGLLPFIGCAKEFGLGPPVNFIQQCRKKLGDVFTIHVGGRYMTFLFDSTLFPTYFHPREQPVDFQLATQPFLHKGFGVEPESYFHYHHACLDAVRSRLEPARLPEVMEALIPVIDQYLTEATSSTSDSSSSSSRSVDLYKVVKDTLFWSSAKVLFGIDKTEAANSGFDQNFYMFDSQFEIACSPLPQILLQKFRRAKSSLLKLLQGVAADPSNGMLAREVVGRVDAPNAASYLLAMLWATEANSVVATMWSACYIAVNHDTVQSSVLEELQRNGYVPNAAVDAQQLSKDIVEGKLAYTRAIVLEAIRLYAPAIIVRFAREEVQLKSSSTHQQFTIPKGNMICLSPKWVMDELGQFDPQHWLGDSKTRQQNISFGSGKYRCPGQYFALAEMTSFLALLVLKFKISMKSFPTEDLIGLVGVPKPEKPNLVIADLQPR